MLEKFQDGELLPYYRRIAEYISKVYDRKATQCLHDGNNQAPETIAERRLSPQVVQLMHGTQ